MSLVTRLGLVFGVSLFRCAGCGFRVHWWTYVATMPGGLAHRSCWLSWREGSR